jgi:hypothetical protein
MRAEPLPRGVHSLSVKLSAGVALVALADIFFFRHPLGWAAGVYPAVLLAVLCMTHGGMLRNPLNRFIALLLCGLSATLVESPQRLSIALYTAGIVTMLLLHKRESPGNAFLWTKDILRFLGRIFTQWKADRRMLDNLRRKGKAPEAKLGATAAYALAPMTLLGVFLMLFTQANPVIAQFLDKIDWMVIKDLLSPLRGLFWLAGGAIIWAALRPRFAPSKPGAPVALPNLDRWFNRHSIILSLALFNALFALQNTLDIAFLWSGKELPEGLNYAEYAHAGAYPLIVTALLAAGYVLLTFSNPKYQSATGERLVYFWIAQNIFLVISAIDRTVNYIEIYSLTYLRIAALIWMGLVALGLALITVRVFLARTNMWLINMNVLALVATLYACCFVNFDRFIADYNVRHAKEVTGSGTNIDLAYIKELGPEALPALRWFELNTKHSATRAVEASLLADDMEHDLAASMNADWRAWTWRKQRRLADILAEIPPPPRPLDDTGWKTRE